MNKHLKALTLITALAVAIIVAPSVGQAAPSKPGGDHAARLAQEDCRSGHLCTWASDDFKGEKTELSCTPGRYGLSNFFSVVNRCADNKSAIIKVMGTVSDGENSEHESLGENAELNSFCLKAGQSAAGDEAMYAVTFLHPEEGELERQLCG